MLLPTQVNCFLFLEVSVVYDSELNITRCAGIKITGLESTEIARKESQTEPVLEEQIFIYFNEYSQKYSFQTALSIALQIALQNVIGVIKRLKIFYITTEKNDEENFSVIKAITAKQPLIEAKCCQSPSVELKDKCDVMICNKFCPRKIKNSLREHGFLIFYGLLNEIGKVSENFEIIFQCSTENNNMYLLRPHRTLPKYTTLKVSNEDFSWVENMKKLINEGSHELIYLYNEGEKLSGLVGLMKC